VKGTNYEAPHYVIFIFLFTSFHLGPNIPLSTLFSYIHNLCPSLFVKTKASTHVSGKIIVLCILIFGFLLVDRRRKEERPEININKHFRNVTWHELWEHNFDMLQFPNIFNINIFKIEEII
jgi:hypothetical protein